jgi:uncharacterized protein (TIGR02246 family)
MKNFVLAAAVLAACGPANTADPATATADAAADEAAIRELIRQAETTNNTADSLGWVALFEEDAVYMTQGIPEVTTIAGLREIASSGFAAYATSIAISPAEVVILGDWAFARSRVSGTATPRAGGDDIPVDLKQLVLYRRQPDGGWKIARFINNSN